MASPNSTPPSSGRRSDEAAPASKQKALAPIRRMDEGLPEMRASIRKVDEGLAGSADSPSQAGGRFSSAQRASFSFFNWFDGSEGERSREGDTGEDSRGFVPRRRDSIGSRRNNNSLLPGRSHKLPPKSMFADAAAMKEKLRQQMCKEEYDVMNFYSKDGLVQAIARSPRFEQATLVVIVLNAIWIGVDADLNDADVLIDADPMFQVVENLFCFYFSLELSIRFGSFKLKKYCLKDPWFVFDAFLVCFMILETWIFTLFLLASGAGGSTSMNTSVLRIGRLMRLSRMARMARLLRAMPELLVLVKGMLAAVRSVFFTLVLLVVLTYVFGIAFTALAQDTRSGELYFSSMLSSMNTLVLNGAFLDELTDITSTLRYDSVHNSSPHLFIMFYLYVLLSTLTVMNMLVGVLCEVVSAVSAAEKEQMQIGMVREKLQHIMREGGMDRDGDGRVSEEEFKLMLDNREAALCLQDVGVDVIGLVDIADFIFEDHDGDAEMEERSLSFPKFMEVILGLRGTNTATVKDITDLRKFIRTSMNRMEAQVEELTEKKQFSEGAVPWKSSPHSSRRSTKESAREPAPEEAPGTPAAATGEAPTTFQGIAVARRESIGGVTVPRRKSSKTSHVDDHRLPEIQGKAADRCPTGFWTGSTSLPGLECEEESLAVLAARIDGALAAAQQRFRAFAHASVGLAPPFGTCSGSPGLEVPLPLEDQMQATSQARIAAALVSDCALPPDCALPLLPPRGPPPPLELPGPSAAPDGSRHFFPALHCLEEIAPG